MPFLAVLPVETSVWWVTGVKQLESEAERSPLFSAKVSEWSYISTPTIRLHGMKTNIFMFTLTTEEVT
jgi:hypothetical protein